MFQHVYVSKFYDISGSNFGFRTFISEIFNIAPQNQIRLEFNFGLSLVVLAYKILCRETKNYFIPPPPRKQHNYQTKQWWYFDWFGLGGGMLGGWGYFPPENLIFSYLCIPFSLYTVILWTFTAYPAVIEYGQILFGVDRNRKRNHPVFSLTMPTLTLTWPAELDGLKQ